MSRTTIAFTPGSGGLLGAEDVGSGTLFETMQIGGVSTTEIARVVNVDPANSSYALVVRLAPRRKRIGTYHFGASATASVQVTAHNGTSTGFFWLQVPVGATVNARLVELRLAQTAIEPTADNVTVPRIALARFTFTGTASGASITPAKHKSTIATNTAVLRTASTGMTVTVGAVVFPFLVKAISFATAVGITPLQFGADQQYQPLADDSILDLGPGEGALLYQPDAGGATTDFRRFMYQGIWEEYDNT